MAQTLEFLLEERKHKIKTLGDMEEKRSSEGDRNYTADEKEEIAKFDKEVDELDTAIEQREEITPHLLEAVERAGADPEGVIVGEYMLDSF